MARDVREKLPWRGPTIGWAVIVLALAAVLFVGETFSGPSRFVGALVLAALMLGALALGPVGLSREKSLLRLIAGAGFFFIAILFLLTFADLLTRL